MIQVVTNGSRPLVFKRANIENTSMLTDQNLEVHFLNRWAAVYHLTRSIPRDKRFDMTTFGVQADTKCGTAACMAGHAMLHPWFRDQGLQHTLAYEGSKDLIFTQSTFFGVYTWKRSPFDPHFCRRVLDNSMWKITPHQASEVVMAWMLYWWPKEVVEAALEATKTVQYSAAFVHKFTPWKGRRPGAYRGVKKV